MHTNIPISKHSVNYWLNLPSSSIAINIANFFHTYKKPTLILTPSILDGTNLTKAIKFFIGSDYSEKVIMFPDRETLPYDQLSPHKDITSERLSILSTLANLDNYILVVSINTIMNLLPPPNFIDKHTFNMKVGQTLNLDEFKLRLARSSYHLTNQVIEHGEYCIKGGILDLFPMGHKIPYRIELFDNQIESIREFDPETQLSNTKVTEINVMSAYEYPLTDDAIDFFKKKYKQEFHNNPKNCALYQSIRKNLPAPGAEYYLPLFFEQTGTLLDYIGKQTIIIQTPNITEASKDFFQQIKERYDFLNIGKIRPVLKSHISFLSEEKLFHQINTFKNIKILQEPLENKDSYDFNCTSLKKFNVDVHKEHPMLDIKIFLESNTNRTLIVADSIGRQEIILSLLDDIGIKPVQVENWHSFINCDSNLCIVSGNILNGCILNNEKITIITEYELFGYQTHLRNKRSKGAIDSKYTLKNLVELDIGEYVVHIDYGIAIYRGLKIINSQNISSEFISLEFAENSMIYVPITSLNLISRYSMANAENISLSKLGTKTWSKTKSKAINQIYDVAAELLNIYALRQQHNGFKFLIKHKEYMKFCSKFSYEETIDQTKACQDILDDMLSPKLMDRLICGDVGFGKTEVAMRATYIAIQNKKQVAILVPTTLLAEQHYKNFIDRFSGFNAKIASLSRFKSKKEKQETLQELKNGNINIVIGTHTLLQKDIDFFDLGLLVVDEEHRFGVKQKEYIKSRRNNIDIISMTATPIPRTLNMSLNGIRDISILATPPLSRLAIKTFILQQSDAIIREGILRELYRGGQVFYLHNNIQTIRRTYDFLHKMIPEAKIKIAHSQIPEKQLEQVMSDFYHAKFNVLLCTTIIETGLDVPTANTIIIDRADRYGLAQLYQLRGRVGRSHHQAYAYFLLPDEKVMTKDAKKRIEAISSLNTLGSGFTLASHDLDIRGSGEILGQEQSGNIQKIGLSLYSELLDQTVASIKNGEIKKTPLSIFEQCEINLNISTIIPESYIYDVKERLVIYKRISSAKNKQDLENIQVELINRFGLLPIEVKNLFKMTEIKLRVIKLDIKRIDLSDTGGYIIFSDNPNIKQENILNLITTKPQTYKLTNANKLTIKTSLPDELDRFKLINTFIDKCQNKTLLT